MNDLKELLSGVTLSTVISAVITCAVALVAASVLKKNFSRMLEKTKLDKGSHRFINNLFSALVYFLVILIVASAFGIDTAPLIALLSVVTLALSLSVQGILTNIIAGLTILTTCPVKKGDYIDASGVSGTVDTIDLIHTKLMTPDGKTVFVPNSDIVNAKITNYSVEGKRRVDLTFTASYDDDTEKVKAALLKATNVPGVIPDMGVFSRVSNYGDNAIEYTVRVWTTTAEYWNVYFDVIENVKRVFDAEQITMTYPHVNVHLDKD